MKNRYKISPITAASDEANETFEDMYKDLVSDVSDDIDYLLDSIDKIFRDGDARTAIDLLNQVKSEVGNIIVNTVSNISNEDADIE